MGNYALMKLSDYLSGQGLSDEDFARAIDASASGVRKLRLGERIPREDMMRRIVAATGGEVMPNDFFDVEAAQ